jgi:hypothetical protein
MRSWSSALMPLKGFSEAHGLRLGIGILLSLDCIGIEGGTTLHSTEVGGLRKKDTRTRVLVASMASDVSRPQRFRLKKRQKDKFKGHFILFYKKANLWVSHVFNSN